MKKQSPFWRIGVAVILILSACNLPGQGAGKTPLPRPGSLPPMPPTVIETIPPMGSQIPLSGQITIYFNQPMDQESVESAWKTEPAVSGELTWDGDSILIFTPGAALPPGSELELILDASMRSRNDQAPASTVNLTFRTANMLALAQVLPEDASSDVVATSAVVASFNQPVVSLGAQASTLPAAFSMEPQAAGKGEWLNTSTYIFYPEPALAGGITYTARLDPGLVAVSGSPLQASEDWSFTVANPRLLSLEPAAGELLRLDAELVLTFNQPMDAASVESSFSLSGPDGSVPGQFEWDENETVLKFTPQALLARNTSYTIYLSAQAAGRGGTPIEGEITRLMHTFPHFYVSSSLPGEGGTLDEYRSIRIGFSTPLQEEDATDLVTISPDAGLVRVYTDDKELHINADLQPQTNYTVTISPELKDIWGQALGEGYTLNFTTAAADPRLLFPYVGGDVYFLRSQSPEFYVQAVNVPYVDIELAPLSMDTFLYLIDYANWQARQNYQPQDADTWRQYIHNTANVNEPVKLVLPENGGALETGFYYFSATSPSVDYNPSSALLVASGVNLTLKVSPEELFVWAVDLRTNEPVMGGNLRLYTSDGYLLASGVTNTDGIWRTTNLSEDPYETYYVILGQPGEDVFGMAGSYWNQDISPWNFGLDHNSQGEHTDIYLYTDRPIYRPGQTVYFRAVVRESFDGQYSLPDITSLEMTLDDQHGQTWPLELPLSSFGTGHGEFTLPEDAIPGRYSIYNHSLNFYFSFSVAEYRKPEINLTVTLEPGQIQKGQDLTAVVNARYFFDAPSGSLPVTWTLYARETYFHLPDYHVGAFTDEWLAPLDSGWVDNIFGETILHGQGVTGPDGTLVIEIPATDLPDNPNRTTLTLEVTAQDESGQPVSGRAVAEQHPDDYYIGIRPDVWVGQAGTAIGFDLLTVDWDGEVDGQHPMHATFSTVTWQRKDYTSIYGTRTYLFTPVFTELASADFATGADGQALLEFTPPNAGTYVLDVQGGEARSQVLLWVGGTSQAVWPNLPHNHVRLTSDRENYQAGQTARVFIPNPLGESALALVSVERGTIHDTQVLELGPSGTVFSLPITEADAPNIYLSATLVGSGSFCQGYINLSVEATHRILNVDLTSSPQRASPRDPLTFDLRVTDQNGDPVQGEFSLAVVDLAALALADPNSLKIVQHYTREEPLGITTSVSLAVDPLRGNYLVGGMGGGGGEEQGSVVREDFPDTAYWNAEIITDANGQATVSMTLPDNLTTWHVDVRGLTADTLVGQAELDIVTSKDLLVRPVTPLFLVAGDRVEVGAVVHNNTAGKLEVKVSLQAINFNLDRSPRQTQKVTIPAGGRTLVTWWGTAQDAENAELTFSAQSGSLSDAAVPANGPVQILHYISPQTYQTGGILSSAGTILEAVSLPRSFDPGGGGLTVELSPSLAAELLSGLASLKDPPTTASNEYLASYLLPNLEVYRAMQDAGLEDAALQERVHTKIQSTLTRLEYHQNYNDGGWAWYTSAAYPWDYDQPDSDPYLTAYILLGLDRASQAGFEVDDQTVQRAREFLFTRTQNRPADDSELDQWALINYTLQVTGGCDQALLNSLLADQELLTPWAQALLALTLEDVSPGAAGVASLITNLETSATRAATGAYWESETSSWRSPSSTLVTSAMVVYALAQRDPASPLLADAVRYLSAHRQAAGGWGSSYETAWIILALNTYMVGTGGYSASYDFDASLNNQPLAEGQASGPSSLTPVTSTVPITSLLPDYPNALSISRTEGPGSLYYRASVQVFQPVENTTPLEKGIRIERNYYPGDCDRECQPVHSVQLDEGTRLTVSLTLTLPHDAYYLMVEDFIPAGAEILNTNLKTSQQGEGSGTGFEVVDPENPYASGWGWWFFSPPQIYDDHIIWSVDFLPAGTYILTYSLIPMHAGEFQVIPARAWLNFFPEVQGRSAGDILEISR